VQIQTPDWVKHAFLSDFPDRFAKASSPQGFEVCLLGSLGRYADSRATRRETWGILEQLDYLQNLELTRFTSLHLQSASNHRYHTHDYYQVDPMLGK